MLVKYYPIQTHLKLQDFLIDYLNLCKKVASYLDLNLDNFEGDHLGLQVISAEEFDKCHEILLNYSSLVNAGRIHNRRNNIYEFNKPLIAGAIKIPVIEVFEPKPDAVISKLKPGIEHISFVAPDYDAILKYFKDNNHPIEKEENYDRSPFFKATLLNMIELEFRKGSLGDI